MLMLLAASIVATAPCRGAASVCDYCAYSSNDTAATPGIVAMDRSLVTQALAPPIAFVGADSLLRCALPAAPGWQIELVDPQSVAGGCSMKLDSMLRPTIGYHDANGVLFWAHRVNAVWVREPVDPISAVMGSTSIAAVPGDRVAIAYVDAATAMLKYAERSSGGLWSAEPVAPVGAVEAYPSLIVDGTARAISYYDAPQGDLRLALSQDGSPWSTQLVDGAGDVGGYSSLVGGPSRGGLGVAYYDFTNADLRYAHTVAGGWAIEPVDGVGVAVGRFCSAVAFADSPDDQVGIGYYDQTHGDLKYAVRRGAWTITVVDTAGDTGGSVSCGGTPLPADTIGIAYLDRAFGNLKYLWGANTVAAVPATGSERRGVHVEWLRSRDGVGGRARFTVPISGRVRVTLYDAQGRLLAVPLRAELPAGPAEARWDGRDEQGARVHAGMVFVRVETPGGTGAAAAVVLR